jgi:hypothetical protein
MNDKKHLMENSTDNYVTLKSIKNDEEKRVRNIEKRRELDVLYYNTCVSDWKNFFTSWVGSKYKLLVEYEDKPGIFIVPNKNVDGNILEKDCDYFTYKKHNFSMTLIDHNKKEHKIELLVIYVEDYSTDIELRCYSCMLSHDILLTTIQNSKKEVDLLPKDHLYRYPVYIPIICFCTTLSEEISKNIVEFLETKYFSLIEKEEE